MEKSQNLLHELETICRQQYEEIEKKKIQLWDMEEENRVMQRCVEDHKKKEQALQNRIDELERWCGHLQGIIDHDAEEKKQRVERYEKMEKRYGIFFKIARKIKRMIFG